MARIVVRTLWLAVLSVLSLPGLFLWAPVFAATKWSVTRFKQTGPPEDVWDEIAQHKLLVGLLSGTCVWLTCVLATLPFAAVSFFFVPCIMWMSLRFMEDAISAFRALTALISLLWIGRRTLSQLSGRRQQLHRRIMTLAVDRLGLPHDPEIYFTQSGGHEKGRVRGSWESNTGYFSIRRRRKRDVSCPM
jgi:glycerol-3-phosphate O-acyltransferase / dihydroxyacetone phosphate acyltransferase